MSAGGSNVGAHAILPRSIDSSAGSSHSSRPSAAQSYITAGRSLVPVAAEVEIEVRAAVTDVIMK